MTTNHAPPADQPQPLSPRISNTQTTNNITNTTSPAIQPALTARSPTSPRTTSLPHRHRRRPSSLTRGPPSPRSRAPSIGELAQEIEYEQEAQVNRLLAQIRDQQAQLAAANQSAASPGSAPGTGTEPFSPSDTADPHARTRSTSRPSASRTSSSRSRPTSTTPSFAELIGSVSAQHPLPPSRRATGQSISRQSSFRSDRGEGTAHDERRTMRRSIADTATSTWGTSGNVTADASHEDPTTSAYRDETSMILRENAMLRARVRELERELASSGRSNSES